MTPEQLRDYEMLAGLSWNDPTSKIIRALRDSWARIEELERLHQAAKRDLNTAMNKLMSIRTITEWK